MSDAVAAFFFHLRRVFLYTVQQLFDSSKILQKASAT